MGINKKLWTKKKKGENKNKIQIRMNNCTKQLYIEYLYLMQTREPDEYDAICRANKK